jgi:hypothetical protein
MRIHIFSSALGRRLRLAAALGSLVASVACAASPASPSAAGTASIDSNLNFCTDEINRYRATVSLPPLSRSGDLETFAAQAVEHDAKIGQPHQYFLQTNGGGVARAENQLLLWKGYAVNDVIRQGVAQMWAEGATGSHYIVMTGNYSQVGCGVYIDGNEVSISQDFR